MTAGQLVALRAVEALSPRVIRILGCNAGPMTLQGTNSYIIGTGKRRLLIDTTEPEIPNYTNLLKTVLQRYGIHLQEIVATHHHIDHVGGISRVVNHVVKDKQIPISKMRWEDSRDEEIPCGKDLQYSYIKDGEEIKTEGATLQAIHTPGHSSDHAAFILKEEEAVLSGDCVLGQGTAQIEDLFKYMESLKKLRSYRPKLIYPGHGPVVTDPEATINEYIKHREAREKQIVNAMMLANGKPLTSAELTRIVYKDIPEDLMKTAEANLVVTLKKMLMEKNVEAISDTQSDKWTLSK